MQHSWLPVYNSLTQNHTKNNLTLNTSDYYPKTKSQPTPQLWDSVTFTTTCPFLTNPNTNKDANVINAQITNYS